MEKCADQFTAGTFDRRRQWRRKCRFGYVPALGSDGSDITSDSYDDFYDDADDIWYEMNDVYDNTDHTALLFAGVIFVVIFMIVFVIIMTVTILLDAFIFNPLEVGCKRFYLRNLNEAALVGNAGYAFDNNYKNIAKTMFFP